ncbi:hypothetical protein [Spiroplasma cantharicola]|uniref:Uncharacterized protein n=1 Tax=Spiroplasma cantharicola TaxID=362837 RepID=A0A0M4JI19_9MOLU|nr:hypothetical protein [Spiroplasma cantharicola]ALD66153.1 hypothetical protein SCANT_v1c02430 [Spiroplasma cantharicola]
MGFSIGMVVSYNHQNYVILEIIEKQIDASFIKFFKLKNLIDKQIITVNSQEVQQIHLKPKQVVNKEETQNQITDTSYIESLFSEIGSTQETDDISLFDLTGENTFTLDDVIFEKYPSDDFENEGTINIFDKTNTTMLVENFQTPEAKVHLTPRRKSSLENISPISETFSNLKMVGEVATKTAEIIPTRKLQAEKRQSEINRIQEIRDFQKHELEYKNKKIKENSSLDETVYNTNDKFKNYLIKELQSEPLNERSSYILKELNSNLISKNDKTKEIDSKDLANVGANEELKNDFTESLEKEFKLNNVSDSSNRVINEKHFDTLETGPLNTKRLFENFNKQQNFQDSLNEKYNNNIENTNTLFGVNRNFNQDALKNSKIYKKFKLMSLWLIILLLLMVITPLVGIFVKTSMYWVENKTIDLNAIFSIASNNAIDMIFVVTSALLALAFLIYLVFYLIVISDKQYKKIAFYNFQLENKVEIIDSIQNYNDESSVYLIKVHNEIKKIKKEINKINQQQLNVVVSKKEENAQKISH